MDIIVVLCADRRKSKNAQQEKEGKRRSKYDTSLVWCRARSEEDNVEGAIAARRQRLYRMAWHTALYSSQAVCKSSIQASRSLIFSAKQFLAG